MKNRLPTLFVVAELDKANKSLSLRFFHWSASVSLANAVAISASETLALQSQAGSLFYFIPTVTPPRAIIPGARKPFSKYFTSKRLSAPPKNVSVTRSEV